MWLRTLDPRAVALVVGTLLLTGGLSAANGGYFPVSWGWSALGALWLSILVLLLSPRVRTTRLELVFAGAVFALSAWTFLSALWASSATQAMFDAERSLVLVGAVVAVIVVGARGGTRLLLGGALAGITLVCVYALLTRLLPGRIATFDPGRLSAGIGYWNGLGLFAVMGAFLALGFAARGRSLVVRAAAAATLVVSLPTVYFTFSRGSWIALGVGLVVVLLVDPRRLETVVALAAFGAAPALAVFLASRLNGLTDQKAGLADARHDGRRLLLWLAVLILWQVLVAIAYREGERRVHVPTAVRRGFAVLLVALLAAAVATGIARYGTPWHLVDRGYHSFTAETSNTGADLNARLFSFSGNGRWQLWQVAGREVRADPIVGGGAGSYEAEWNAHRPVATAVNDAHNLYLEMLAELGAVGLALLVVVLGLPVLTALRRRTHPLVPVALGAFAAYLVHAIVDWDWELAGVTVTALLIGLACLAAERVDTTPREVNIGPRTAAVAAAALAAVAVFAIAALAGNSASASADRAARARDWQAAADHAHDAIRWAPWSARGWQQLGEAQVALRQRPQGERNLRKAAAKDPRDWTVWFDLAASQRGSKRKAALATALHLNPLSPEIAQLKAVAR